MIKPTCEEWKPAFRKPRKEQVTLFQFRIGLIQLKNSSILKQEEQPSCIAY